MMKQTAFHTTKQSRRRFIRSIASTAAAGSMLSSLKAERTLPVPYGKAKNCIMIWLGGGMSQIDTFDPKKLGHSKSHHPGSEYPSIPTCVPEVRVCEHLKGCAEVMDRMTVIRTVHHDVIDEHGAAVIRVHTGRPTSGTIQYPSIGSIVSRVLGKDTGHLPPYMVIGYPNIARDPGFLGPAHGYLYVTDTQSGPTGLSRPAYISDSRHSRREALLNKLRKSQSQNRPWQDYDQMLTKSLELAGPTFMRAFDLEQENSDTRNSYGGEFGQRCLLARRLVERGVKFVEVSHNLNFVNGSGWDTHFEGQQNQHLLIRELDTALSSLIKDLEKRGTLDDTLIVVGTEFGRPAQFDARGGRGHHGKCFSMVLAGGGLNHRGAYGKTNELAMQVEDHPVSIPDFHATIYTALGIHPAKELFSGNRPVPITDGGSPIQALLS